MRWQNSCFYMLNTCVCEHALVAQFEKQCAIPNVDREHISHNSTTKNALKDEQAKIGTRDKKEAKNKYKM